MIYNSTAEGDLFVSSVAHGVAQASVLRPQTVNLRSLNRHEGREVFAAAIAAGGLIVASFRAPRPKPIRVEAPTSAEAVRGGRVVLLCVKTLDTKSAAQSIAPHLAKGAVE